ncbi:uncharacterized protein MELLADRAFT_117813 [Melampsora larici-populina 98AG31]|uniref:Inositol polyphosphate-related phosphatase domain-containing protein n=1 Tax=Melampsora larici-populina (strain 98AG31 / pathotype 3-4-7) TaxID=747676 RepID=F4S1U0_MELLP|nr:uncharacterized protein MELLADRAFT_117813 [Melampsora larici-populina 98AG31]EGG01434.1 hypothetical protein MELLADRAFT_117813 [Melampsora larici-populina 98AG31]
MEFKACNSFEDGKVGGKGCRYVWCGAKDGQLFEYDCFERRMIDSKASLHSASIIGIFRCKFGGMCTLDETAKVQIWTNPISPKIGVKISGTARAQRVADKTNFAAMLSHQLWTSSGPSGSKSASTLAQRSPSIRVYDPDPTQAWTVTPRPLSIPDNGSTIGAVSAGAVIPSTPSIVYLGHETGHVSIWNNKEEKNGGVGFKKLIKISNYQITALEGVTKYLWAGFRTGNVYVYDTCEQQQDDSGGGGGGWKVLKVWKAHKESITRIVVDPSLLWDDEASKLHVATTSTDWKVKLWDGTMGADWLATEMRKRESEFCAYRPMRVLICSWNIDACKPSELNGTSDNLNFLDDVLKSSEESPDVIVFGFQEMIDLDNKKLTAKTVLLGSRKKGAEKLSDAVSQSYRLWHDRLVAAVRLAMPADEPYVVAHTQNLVGLFTCVFVKVSERAKMRDIAITTVKTGMKGRYGNKGAIIARFVVDDSSICFINCHLAAGQKNLRQRHEDLIDILEEKSGFPDPPESTSGSGGAIGNAYVGGGNGSAIADHEICFLYGDLNYRIDRGREEVIRAIASGEYLKLLEDDQLRKEKRFNAGFRLKSFREAPITFHPTYKYDPGTHMYDSSEKNRVPAWCDRILYRTPNTNQEVLNQSEEIKFKPLVTSLNYKRYEVNISDHRPISGSFLVSVKSIVPGLRRGIWQEVLGRWKAYEVDVKEVARGYYSGL